MTNLRCSKNFIRVIEAGANWLPACSVDGMKILIAYDGSTHADTAIDDLQWAGLPTDSQVIVLSAVEWPLHAPRSWGMVDTPFPREWSERVAAAEQLAKTACNRVHSYFRQWDVQSEVPTGDAATAVLEKANAWGADLVVVGTHGRSGLARAVLGSVSLKLVREAHCSVRVARRRKHDGLIRLMIADDGSAEAQAAVTAVCRRSWPAHTEARVVAVHEILVTTNAERVAIDPNLYSQINYDEHLRLKHAANEAAEKLRHAGLIVSPVVEEGDPKDVLLEEARNWNADAIFVGARGLGRVDRFLLGSVSSATVAHAPCTVEVVRLRLGCF